MPARRAITGLLLLATCLAAGCARSPEATVRRLVRAAREGDRTTVIALLSGRTVARLAEDARRASEQAGQRTISPEELLAVGWAGPRWEMERAREISRTGNAAVVEVTGHDGEQQRVDLVLESGEWKVVLP